LLIYTLEAGKYRPSRLFTFGDRVRSQAIPGFELDLEEVFGEV
ncbi:MAG: Uma2 family endonuclease, partial [Cyclobacterium sp.]